MKIKTANGVSGVLIFTIAGEVKFRVYDTSSFTDYDIMHSDLSITIDDDDAYFYVDSTTKKLDHSPNTLGLKHG